MKAVILLLALITVSASAQVRNIPEKGDNVIQIVTDRTPEGNYQEFGKHLVSNGYAFKTKNPDFLMLSTEPKSSKYGLNYDYELNITFKDNLIIIRAKQSFMTMSYQLAWTNWEYAKSGTNLNKNSFDDFNPVIQAYGYPIEYSKE